MFGHHASTCWLSELSFTSCVGAHSGGVLPKSTIRIMVNSGSANSSELSESKHIFDLYPEWLSSRNNLKSSRSVVTASRYWSPFCLSHQSICILVVPGIGSTIFVPFRNSPFAVEGYSGGMESDEGGWSAVLENVPSRSESPEGFLHECFLGSKKFF